MYFVNSVFCNNGFLPSPNEEDIPPPPDVISNHTQRRYIVNRVHNMGMSRPDYNLARNAYILNNNTFILVIKIAYCKSI